MWWKEAFGAFADRPVAGYGAGSFPVIHLQYRKNELAVRQPHDVPLEFLSETGLIGGVLGVGAVVALLVAAAAGARARGAGHAPLPVPKSAPPLALVHLPATNGAAS